VDLEQFINGGAVIDNFWLTVVTLPDGKVAMADRQIVLLIEDNPGDVV